MSERAKYGAALLLFLGGFVFLGISYLSWGEKPKISSAERTERSVQYILKIPMAEEPAYLDVNALFSTEAFRFEKPVPKSSDTDVLALFVLSVKNCAPCIDEVVDYADLIHVVQDTSSLRIEPVALVVDLDTTQAARFVKIVDLSMPTTYGSPLAAPFAAELNPLRQMIFIRMKDDLILASVVLSNTGITSIDIKQGVLSGMLRQAYLQNDK